MNPAFREITFAVCFFRPEQPEHVVTKSVEVEPACKRVKPNNGKVSFKIHSK